jgi:hypothetical protein
MKRIFLLLLVVSLFSSCDDAIEIVQDGEINDAAVFTSVANMQLYLNETYDRVSTQNDIMVSSRLTDEVGLGIAGFPDQTHRFFVVSTNGFASGIWSQHYQAINYCNRLIRGAALYTPEASEEADYNNILAQARALRAFCHFQLLTYFSTDLSNDAAPGVMKMDYVPTITQLNPRATNGEVFELIEDDLSYAETNLTTPTTGANSWKFVNINVVNSLRARMYLYRKNYTLAEQYADAVIGGSGLNLSTSTFTNSAAIPQNTNVFAFTAGQTTALTNMELPNATTVNAPEYRRMWTDQIQGEVLFALGRQNNVANFGSQYNTNQSNFGGGPLYDMGRTLFALFTDNNNLGGTARDYRRWTFVDRTSNYAADPNTATKENDNVIIDKYPGKVGNTGSNDLKVFRLSEMYFIKAECRVQAGDLTGAADLIRQVRQARNYIPSAVVPALSYANATAAYADILLERRKELCFEGHRYIDLKRIGTLAGVTQTDRFLRDSDLASATNPYNINVTDYRFTLPIPQNEINVNPMQQNPEY